MFLFRVITSVAKYVVIEKDIRSAETKFSQEYPSEKIREIKKLDIPIVYEINDED